MLTQEEDRVNVDRQLAQALAQGPPTLLGFYFNEVGGMAPPKAGKFMTTSAPRACTYNLVRCLDGEPTEIPIISAKNIVLNLEEINAGCAGGGFFNMVPDEDGCVRWLPQAIVYGPDIFIPLSLAVVQQYLGCPPLALTLSRAGVEGVRLGDREIPGGPVRPPAHQLFGASRPVPNLLGRKGAEWGGSGQRPER